MITPPQVGARWGDRFDIVEAREGGPGRLTFIAHDRAFGQDVELWWILPGVHRDDAAVALVGGSGAMRGLLHPSVRTLVDAGFDEGTTWAAYALASPGVQPREKSPLPVPAAAAWARAVGAGLGAAHQRGWFHGRLVPADVVLVDASVRVGGLALWVMAEPVSVAAWNAHASYLAPEVVAGWTVGPPADVWALAASVAALAVGSPRAIDERGWLEARSPALAQALASALVPDPAGRCSLAELVARIDAAAATVGAEAFAPVPSRMVAAAAIGGGGAGGGGGGAFAPLPSQAVAPPVLPAGRPAAPGAGDDVAFAPVPSQAVATSFRPGGQRPPTGQLPAAQRPLPPPDPGEPRVVMRPLSELSIVNVEAGEIGYVAPPRELTPPRRRWLPVVSVLGGATAAATIALVVATQTGTDEPVSGGSPAGDTDDVASGAEPGAAAAAAPRLPLSPVEPARGCTDQTLALGDACIDPYEAPGKGHLPMTALTARAAADACAARGLRLCTPAEWRQACEGTERALAVPGACNLGGGAVIAAAGGFERCVSAIDAHDLAGNVAEWVADGTALGGSALDGGEGRCDGPARPAPEGATFPDVGFRCCGDR